MNPEKITVNAFCVIGKVGSTDDGKDIVQRLQKFSGIQKEEISLVQKIIFLLIDVHKHDIIMYIKIKYI